MPHPRAHGNHVRVISRYVKERGVISLEEAVRKMTSWPATRMRLENRGSIKGGHRLLHGPVSRQLGAGAVEGQGRAQ
ncbi:MAG TPA: hypothetical protein VF981_09285 [Gemmatimonadaceae bacterium]